MAIADNVAMTHVAFGDRPRYGSPYPEGVALGRSSVTGDLTGGNIVVSFQADGGFLYRFEAFHAEKDQVAVNEDWVVLFIHGWATEKTDFGTGAFNVLHKLGRELNTVPGILTYTMSDREQFPARRFPLGRVDSTADQLLAQLTIGTNTDGANYLAQFVCTYWRKEATYLPGFISSFYEAPVVPGISS